MVGSMVQFANGVPDKKNYRRFKIKPWKGWTILHRSPRSRGAAPASSVRVRHSPTSSSSMAGRGKLAAAQGVLQEIGCEVPVISLAKREEEVYVPGRDAPPQAR